MTFLNKTIRKDNMIPGWPLSFTRQKDPSPHQAVGPLSSVWLELPHTSWAMDRAGVVTVRCFTCHWLFSTNLQRAPSTSGSPPGTCAVRSGTRSLLLALHRLLGAGPRSLLLPLLHQEQHPDLPEASAVQWFMAK